MIFCEQLYGYAVTSVAISDLDLPGTVLRHSQPRLLLGVSEMEETFVPFRGIKNDIHNRLLCYKQDWSGGFKAGFRYAPEFHEL